MSHQFGIDARGVSLTWTQTREIRDGYCLYGTEAVETGHVIPFEDAQRLAAFLNAELPQAIANAREVSRQAAQKEVELLESRLDLLRKGLD